jgi:hypothetical protein
MAKVHEKAKKSIISKTSASMIMSDTAGTLQYNQNLNTTSVIQGTCSTLERLHMIVAQTRGIPQLQIVFLFPRLPAIRTRMGSANKATSFREQLQNKNRKQPPTFLLQGAKTLEKRLFSILVAMESFRFSGSFRFKMVLCCKPKESCNTMLLCSA